MHHEKSEAFASLFSCTSKQFGILYSREFVRGGGEARRAGSTQAAFSADEAFERLREENLLWLIGIGLFYVVVVDFNRVNRFWHKSEFTFHG